MIIEKVNSMKKIWKIVLIGFFSILIIASFLIILINSYVKITTKSQIITDRNLLKDYHADCILVLGAGVSNGKPSPMLEDRLQKGVELYENQLAPKIIMSGDHGRQEYDEVNVMKNYAIDKGVPSEDIFMDHAGFKTYDSIYRAKEIFQSKKIIIVTQEYHLSRALYIANKLGLEAVGVPAEKKDYSGNTLREVREILARNKDFVQCMFKPEPTVLGDAIPVSGNGDQTNDK